MKKQTKSKKKQGKRNKTKQIASPKDLLKQLENSKEISPKETPVKLEKTKKIRSKEKTEKKDRKSPLKKSEKRIPKEIQETILPDVRTTSGVLIPEESLSELEQTSKLWKWVALVLLIAAIAIAFISFEIRSSHFQSKIFYKLSKDIDFNLVNGEGELPNAPLGPYDLRLGYSHINEYVKNLKSNSFKQDNFSQLSKEGIDILKYGLNLPYNEKAESGLFIKAYDGSILTRFKEPTWVFPTLDSISPYIVNTLLFIEDRNLLSPIKSHHNPAVEWDRFLKATSDLVLKKVFGHRDVPGGSTLATQIEKFRHSPDGLTLKPIQKLTQMGSASLKAYHKSIDTLDARKDIALDYINSVPLAAVPGYGEVFGLGDGLWAYYGEDPKKLNEALTKPINIEDTQLLLEQATSYKEVLSLFLAHRRPTDYLIGNPAVLEAQVSKYLPALFNEGIIPYPLYSTALETKISHRTVLPHVGGTPYTLRKGPNVIRTHLLQLMKVKSLYDLDRIDAEVESTLAANVQESITRILLSLHSKKETEKLGLDGFRLLSTSADPAKVIYSFTLFENVDGVDKLRIQTDTFNQPFNINEGVKLDLGSTAKFRTLVTYLEVIEEIYNNNLKLTKKELRSALTKSKDNLSKWVLATLIDSNETPSLSDVLERAMDRQYSASTSERFFTAGGVHTFSNFKRSDDGRTVTMREAIRHSINLPLIRLMRDVSKYFTYNTKGSSVSTVENMSEEVRKDYLEQFANKEGKIFMGRFYLKYKGKTSEEILTILMDSVKRKPGRFASIFWFLHPEAGIEEFIEFMKKHIDHEAISRKELEKYYTWYTERAKTLGDKGYLARTHPLELLVAAVLIKNPETSLSELFENTMQERIFVYDWLMNTSRRHAQDKRIQIILETEAFTEIHRRWVRLGYALPSLVPSYATALGTSADRPDSLSELMGIILNNGKKCSKSSIDKIHFAKDTPYETTLSFTPKECEQVLSPEIAQVGRDALMDVVSNGTAIRLKDGIKVGDTTLHLGGKTGTGDHRYKVFRNGVRINRVVNRTATFMFILGDRFFGTLTAFVPGEDAAKFRFTSALPVQLVKMIAPELEPLIKLSCEKKECK